MKGETRTPKSSAKAKKPPGATRLDVGCGVHPTGDVNCDLFLGRTPHRGGVCLDTEVIPNFVNCDAHWLPFGNRSFSEVYLSHTLEHCLSPHRVLEESRRVARERVIVVVPNYKTVPPGEESIHARAHLYSWDDITLKNLLFQVFPSVEVREGLRKPFRGKILELLRRTKLLIPLALWLENKLRGMAKRELIAVCRVE
ncbi:MAG: methyltransferase domain-containing protein [Candidatus Geothermarchaeales archaeon]